MSREDIVKEWALTSELFDYSIQGSRVQAIGQKMIGKTVAFGQVDVKAGDTVADINTRLNEAYKANLKENYDELTKKIDYTTDLLLKTEQAKFDLKRKAAGVFLFLTNLGVAQVIEEKE